MFSRRVKPLRRFGIGRRRGGSWLLLATLVAWLPALLFAALGAVAAGGRRVDVDNGHELARAWCRSCHGVEPHDAVGPYADVPTFTAVARMRSTTSASLRVFLTTPHGDMPDIRLKPDQIDEIVAYILSLNDRS